MCTYALVCAAPEGYSLKSASINEPDFEKMMMERAFARYNDPMQIQQRINKIAAIFDTCCVCGELPAVMKALYFHDERLLRTMSKPCRATNEQRLLSRYKEIYDVHHYTLCGCAEK